MTRPRTIVKHIYLKEFLEFQNCIQEHPQYIIGSHNNSVESIW